MSEGKNHPSPWSELRSQIFLGSANYVETVQAMINGGQELSEVPLSQRRPKPLSLGEYERKSESRNEAIFTAYLSGGYTLNEISQYFDLHYSTISGIVRNHKSKT